MSFRDQPVLPLIKHEMVRLFSLKEDKADDETIDQNLRAGIELRGTNLWVLMSAIFIASIGLNVNSTAVIIGAMLISPLMGPIMGIGYGVGIYDFPLIRAALKNLGIAVLISLLTSVVYFWLTPLKEAQSELLARTTPTIWDVLIALSGGFAGIVGVTRVHRSNVIPGVAIATALMPPICTAGYSLANGNWAYFGGAFYLFTINSVFIALSSAFVIRAFHVRQKKFVDVKASTRVKRYAFLVAILTVLPSVYLAYALVQEAIFKSNARQFIAREFATDKTYVTQSNIDPSTKKIELTVIGDYLPASELGRISQHLAGAGLGDAKLEVHQQADQQHIDVSKLKSGLLSDLYTKSQLSLEIKDQKIQDLKNLLKEHQVLMEEMKQIPDELYVLFPQVSEMWLSEAISWTQEKAGVDETPVFLLNLKVKKPLTTKERETIEQWLSARIKSKKTKLIVDNQVEAPVKVTKAKKKK
ncbi:MAG: DUF389 domain-containing protein [Burkholderiales bacterium]|nr:DUF389 domain-containing protein [Burkholderiales bacterium]